MRFWGSVSPEHPMVKTVGLGQRRAAQPLRIDRVLLQTASRLTREKLVEHSRVPVLAIIHSGTVNRVRQRVQGTMF